MSFKNSKMLLPAKDNRPAMLITAPEKQKAMKEYIRAIEYELCSAFRTSATGMPMGHRLRSWIASCVPLDDSVKWIRELSVVVEDVEPGEEGADITIERIEPTGQLSLDDSPRGQ